MGISNMIQTKCDRCSKEDSFQKVGGRLDLYGAFVEIPTRIDIVGNIYQEEKFLCIDCINKLLKWGHDESL